MVAAVVVAGVSVAATAAQAGWNATHQPDIPELPPLPANATEDDKKARAAAVEARKSQRVAQATEGRGSTILTGGKLGSLGEYDGKPKSLLGQ